MKTVLEMAIESKLLYNDWCSPCREDTDIQEQVEAFAALVAAAEREACAKVCEDLFDPRWRSEHNAASQ